MKRFLLCLLLLFCAQSARAQVQWPAERGAFALCLLNAPSGFWVGTEDQGLWRRDAGGNWKQFTAKDGLGGDSVRCLLSRGDQLWAGHARDGLSIWDGAKWNHLGVADGLPSERVNDLALADNGDVWVATDGGLCRWNDQGGWTVPTSLLAHRQIVALACARGNVWAATACDGLLKSSDRGASWTQIVGAPIQPVTATGDGLPSSVTNDVAVDELGQIWVATDLGLARSSDEGASWFFVRGADWQANVKGTTLGLRPGGDEARVEPPGEDWVQSLAPDGAGHIWLGFRQQGAEVRDIQSAELLNGTRFTRGAAAGPTDDWVRAIWPLPNQRAILARYGGGVGGVTNADWPAPTPVTAPAKLKVPGAFATLSAEAIAPLAATGASSGSFWKMDYATRGDWIGRYGQGLGYVYDGFGASEFRGDPRVQVGERIGPHAAKGQTSPYSWVAYNKSENPDVLYNPVIATRRMVQTNDGSWQHDLYPFSWEGPDLWYSFEVGPGASRIALYFYNDDGHEGLNRYRDYVLELKPWQDDLRDADAAPALAKCRVSDFWSGVYASFAVSGPGKYLVKVGRHRSFVTICSGAFVDALGPVAPDVAASGFFYGVSYETKPTPAPLPGENATITAARAAWQSLDVAATRGEVTPDGWPERQRLLRAATTAGADAKLLFNWRWKLGIWTAEDRAGFVAAMAQIEAKRQQSLAQNKAEEAQ